jgi:hypothetical protein
LQILNLEPKKLEDEYRSTTDYSSAIVIFDEFSGSQFDFLRKRGNVSAKARIFGPNAVIEAAKTAERSLPTSLSGYPVFCNLLHNCVLSITGMKSRERMVHNFLRYGNGADFYSMHLKDYYPGLCDFNQVI